MGTGGPFPGGKARPGRDADNSPPSSAEVVNEELYHRSPLTPPWRDCFNLHLSIRLYRLHTGFRIRKEENYRHIWKDVEVVVACFDE